MLKNGKFFYLWLFLLGCAVPACAAQNMSRPEAISGRWRFLTTNGVVTLGWQGPGAGQEFTGPVLSCPGNRVSASISIQLYSQPKVGDHLSIDLSIGENRLTIFGVVEDGLNGEVLSSEVKRTKLIDLLKDADHIIIDEGRKSYDFRGESSKLAIGNFVASCEGKDHSGGRPSATAKTKPQKDTKHSLDCVAYFNQLRQQDDASARAWSENVCGYKGCSQLELCDRFRGDVLRSNKQATFAFLCKALPNQQAEVQRALQWKEQSLKSLTEKCSN